MSIGTRYKVKCFLHSESFVTLSFWTSKDVAVVKIEQGETWDANNPVLKEFYFKHIFPKNSGRCIVILIP